MIIISQAHTWQLGVQPFEESQSIRSPHRGHAQSVLPNAHVQNAQLASSSSASVIPPDDELFLDWDTWDMSEQLSDGGVQVKRII